MIILITGIAGFIGSNLLDKLLQDENNFIIGIYYRNRQFK